MRRLLAAAAGTCLALASAPAVASTAAGSAGAAWVVTGSRTASTVVTLRRPLTLFNGDPGAGQTGPTITGEADLSGYLLAEPSGRRILAGMVTTTRLRPQGSPATFRIGGGSVRLPAGRYLLTLVASETTRVRIPVAGLATDVVHRPDVPVPVRVKDSPLDPQVGTSTGGRTAITVSPRTVTLVGLALTSTGTGGEGEMEVSSPRDRVLVGFVYQPIPPPEVNSPHAVAYVLLPGDVGPARYEVAWSARAEGLFTSARGVAVTIG